MLLAATNFPSYNGSLKQFDANVLVTALMGASPKTSRFCKKIFPDIDFKIARKNVGRIRIETVEDMQYQIVAMINLQLIQIVESMNESR